MAAIRMENEDSEYQPIKRGLRQGYLASLDLFTLHDEMVLRNFNERQGVNVDVNNINSLRYTDVKVLTENSAQKPHPSHNRSGEK